MVPLPDEEPELPLEPLDPLELPGLLVPLPPMLPLPDVLGLLPPEVLGLLLLPELLLPFARSSRMHFSFSEPVIVSHLLAPLAPELAPPLDEPVLPPELPDVWASETLAMPSNAAVTAAPINFMLMKYLLEEFNRGDCEASGASAMPACPEFPFRPCGPSLQADRGTETLPGSDSLGLKCALCTLCSDASTASLAGPHFFCGVACVTFASVC